MEGQGLSVLWEKDNKIEKEKEQEGEKERSEEVENLNVGQQTNKRDSESYWLFPGQVTGFCFGNDSSANHLLPKG